MIHLLFDVFLLSHSIFESVPYADSSNVKRLCGILKTEKKAQISAKDMYVAIQSSCWAERLVGCVFFVSVVS